eukprot:scaffold111434_cov63-Phaeocystis_antarctica.AAC.6
MTAHASAASASFRRLACTTSSRRATRRTVSGSAAAHCNAANALSRSPTTSPAAPSSTLRLSRSSSVSIASAPTTPLEAAPLAAGGGAARSMRPPARCATAARQ